MNDHKMQAAERALQFIEPGQTIGLGDGTAVLYLADLIAEDRTLRTSLTLTTSSMRTAERLDMHDVASRPLSGLSELDIYFDGCDQFDQELNALKSGSGIHTSEKIAAAMAKQFILIGDAEKYSEQLSNRYPVVLDVVPFALKAVRAKLARTFPDVSFELRSSSDASKPTLTAQGNLLLELHFTTLPLLADMDIYLKMLPGVLNHSLFYRMATSAVISGPAGIVVFEPLRRSVQ